MYKLFLSLRYFRSRFLALAAFLSITFGVAMLLIVLAVMGGYMEQIRENIRGQESHLHILGRGAFGVRDFDELESRLLEVENVLAVAPFIERLAIYMSGVSWKPCQLQGMDPARQARLNGFGRYVLTREELESLLSAHLPPALDPEDPASWDAPAPEVDVTSAMRGVHEALSSREPLTPEQLESFFSHDTREQILSRHNPLAAETLDEVPAGVLVGARLFFEQEVFLGQVLNLMTLRPTDGAPISENFVVVGAIQTGDFNVDSNTLFADVRKMRSLLDLFSTEGDPDDGVSGGGFRYQGLRVALVDPERLEESRDRVEAAARALDPTLVVRTWKELRQNMLRAVKIEKVIVSVLVLLLVLFTGSMVLLMLVLTVIEKTRDIGVLMALGATANGVAAIFLLNGLLISLLGTVAGLGLGWGFCAQINEIHDWIYEVTGRKLFPAEIYQMDRIPIAFQVGDILITTVTPVAIGFLASLLPALWAPRRDPIKAIQYE